MTDSGTSLYDRHGPDWWGGSTRWLRQLSKLVPARLAQFDPVVGDWRGLAVLDLGCGGGFMAEALALRGAAVMGVDPSEPALEAARRHAAEGSLSIAYRQGVGEAIPVATGSMDVVVCVDVLEHVDDLDRVLDEVRRVLKPGGLFLFDTVNRTWLATLVMVRFAETILRILPPGTHEPDRFVRPEDLRAALSARGFTVPPFVGFGPRGLDSRGDFTFGPLPTTAVLYLGQARAPG